MMFRVCVRETLFSNEMNVLRTNRGTENCLWLNALRNFLFQMRIIIENIFYAFRIKIL